MRTRRPNHDLFKLVSSRGAAAAAALLILASPSWAAKVKDGGDPLDGLAFSKPELWVGSDTADFDAVRSSVPAPLASAFDTFRAQEGGSWRMSFDAVTG